MAITGVGWELQVKRLGLQVSDGVTRTYASYQVYHEGTAAAGLAGYLCESPGPGANAPAGNGKRVEGRTYPLWTQFGRYRSIGYSTSSNEAVAVDHMPGLLLQATGKRVGILIHPAHPPKLFLSSIGCLNLTNAVGAKEQMNFWDSRARVIALIQDLRAFAPQAFQQEVATRIAGASVVIEGEPMNVLADPLLAAMTASPALSTPAALPLSKAQAIRCAQWMMDHFGDKIRAAVAGKPYEAKHITAIVCQETAYKWLKWTENLTPAQIVERCVFDASGDFPGTSRGAFPKTTAAFLARYGQGFTDLLIEEANKTRRLQGWDDKPWVYKGYGIFQYDLQHVTTDQAFFENRGWYSFGACLERCCRELDRKLAATGDDLWKAIKAYNGSGPAAAQYQANVRAFTDYCATVTG